MHPTDLIPLRLRIERHGPHRKSGRTQIAPRRTLVSLIGVAALSPLLLMALPAQAATSGANAGVVTLTPAAVRSVTVTPATSTFANCTGGNPARIARFLTATARWAPSRPVRSQVASPLLTALLPVRLM